MRKFPKTEVLSSGFQPFASRKQNTVELSTELRQYIQSKMASVEGTSKGLIDALKCISYFSTGINTGLSILRHLNVINYCHFVEICFI